MKKVKRGTTPRVDERRPSKPVAPAVGTRVSDATNEVAPPTYEGPEKTDKKPRQARGAGTSKPALKAGQVRRPRAASGDPSFEDQVPPKTRRRGRSGSSREQYIRMRVRVRGDRLSVVDSHLVDGPLGQAPGFSGANAYEVTLDDRLLHAGSLPDLGVQRSFVNPDGPPSQLGHHFTERPTYEFMARVPADEVTHDTIGRIAVRLHRVKEEARSKQLGTTPLAQQFAREVRPVAELVGLPVSVLPAAIEERGGRTPNI
jgi:hypothetical protein